MRSTYQDIIHSGTQTVEKALRQSANHGQRVYVFAMHGTPTHAGYLVALADSEGYPPGGPRAYTCVRPLDTPAAFSGDWRLVPYSHLYATLWEACRHIPILQAA